MAIKLSRDKIKELFTRQMLEASAGPQMWFTDGSTIHIYAWGEVKGTSLCPFCGEETGPGADMHRRCFNAASPQERYLVMDAQIEALTASDGISTHFARGVLQQQQRICNDCGRRWFLMEEGWECPECVNV